MVFTRRTLLRGSAAAGATLVLPAALLAPIGDAGDAGQGAAYGRASPAAIAVVGAGPDDHFGRGALLGVDEARRSAELLRAPLEIRQAAAPRQGEIAGFVQDLLGAGVGGIVLALGDPALHEAAESAAAAAGLVVIDARASRPDALAREGAFRIGLPRAALREAARRAGVEDAEAVLWHPDLFRYGSEQLMGRYGRKFGTPMTGEAWAGWMGVKALAEAALRARGGGRAALLERLGGDRATFDGHKGAPLAFTAPARSLAQPIYVVGPEGIQELSWPWEEEG